MKYKVNIRRSDTLEVRPEAEQLDGLVWEFRKGWLIDDGLYEDEFAMIPDFNGWPHNAPDWIASGDLLEK